MHKYTKFDIEMFSFWNKVEEADGSSYWNFTLLLTTCPGFNNRRSLRGSKYWLFNI